MNSTVISTSQEALYNSNHRETLKLAATALSIYKSRFRRLQLLSSHIHLNRRIVRAGCILHNITLLHEPNTVSIVVPITSFQISKYFVNPNFSEGLLIVSLHFYKISNIITLQNSTKYSIIFKEFCELFEYYFCTTAGTG